MRIDKKMAKTILNSGFKQYLKKLKGTYEKAKVKPKFDSFDKAVLYNAYNNGFTSAVVFCNRLIEKEKEGS